MVMQMSTKSDRRLGVPRSVAVIRNVIEGTDSLSNVIGMVSSRSAVLTLVGVIVN